MRKGNSHALLPMEGFWAMPYAHHHDQSERGETVYVIPSGTIEAYQRYLQLQPKDRTQDR